jgi:hypothetical protein
MQVIQRLVVKVGDGHGQQLQGAFGHKTKQLRSKLAQDFEKTRVRESSSPTRGKIPQLWWGKN